MYNSAECRANVTYNMGYIQHIWHVLITARVSFNDLSHSVEKFGDVIETAFKYSPGLQTGGNTIKLRPPPLTFVPIP